jgi:hypothetical protein
MTLYLVARENTLCLPSQLCIIRIDSIPLGASRKNRRNGDFLILANRTHHTTGLVACSTTSQCSKSNITIGTYSWGRSLYALAVSENALLGAFMLHTSVQHFFKNTQGIFNSIFCSNLLPKFGSFLLYLRVTNTKANGFL